MPCYFIIIKISLNYNNKDEQWLLFNHRMRACSCVFDSEWPFLTGLCTVEEKLHIKLKLQVKVCFNVRPVHRRMGCYLPQLKRICFLGLISSSKYVMIINYDHYFLGSSSCLTSSIEVKILNFTSVWFSHLIVKVQIWNSFFLRFMFLAFSS